MSDNPRVWLETNNYMLMVKERKFFSVILNGSTITMDAGQRLICKALGRLESYQSGLNCQKRGIPFFNIGEEHIQLMHNGSNQWLTLFSSNDRVRICDGFYTNLTPVIKSCLKPSTSLKLNKIRNCQLP